MVEEYLSFNKMVILLYDPTGNDGNEQGISFEVPAKRLQRWLL